MKKKYLLVCSVAAAFLVQGTVLGMNSQSGTTPSSETSQPSVTRLQRPTRQLNLSSLPTQSSETNQLSVTRSARPARQLNLSSLPTPSSETSQSSVTRTVRPTRQLNLSLLPTPSSATRSARPARQLNLSSLPTPSSETSQSSVTRTQRPTRQLMKTSLLDESGKPAPLMPRVDWTTEMRTLSMKVHEAVKEVEAIEDPEEALKIALSLQTELRERFCDPLLMEIKKIEEGIKKFERKKDNAKELFAEQAISDSDEEDVDSDDPEKGANGIYGIRDRVSIRKTIRDNVKKVLDAGSNLYANRIKELMDRKATLEAKLKKIGDLMKPLDKTVSALKKDVDNIQREKMFAMVLGRIKNLEVMESNIRAIGAAVDVPIKETEVDTEFGEQLLNVFSKKEGKADSRPAALNPDDEEKVEASSRAATPHPDDEEKVEASSRPATPHQE